MSFGREKLSWNQEIWNRIDRAVHDECVRTRAARKFLLLYGPVSNATLTVPSDPSIPVGGNEIFVWS